MPTNMYAKHIYIYKQFDTSIILLLLKTIADPAGAWMVLIVLLWSAKLMVCAFECMLQVNLLLQLMCKFVCVYDCIYVECKEENQMKINQYMGYV